MKLILREMFWKPEERKQYIDLTMQLIAHKQAMKKKADKTPQTWRSIKDAGERKKAYQTFCKSIQEKNKPIIDKIKAIKSDRQTIGMKFFAAKLTMGKEEIRENWSDSPPKMVENGLRVGLSLKVHEHFKKYREDRKKRKATKEYAKQILGYNYKITTGGSKTISGKSWPTDRGGVFTQPGTILKMVGTVNDDARLNAEKKPLAFKKEKYVGVELELIAKCSREFLMDQLILEKLQSYVKIKDDGSIETESTHPHRYEIVIMASEEEIDNVIDRVCKVLHSKRVEAKANNSCGLHVHLDMRHRNVVDCYKMLYFSQTILLGMVPFNRKESSHAQQYCKKNTLASFADHEANSNRYHVINTHSYNKYKTLEVRVHSGSTNAMKIKNWIKVLTKIVNGPDVPASHFKNHLNSFCQFFNVDEELKTYIEKRTKKFEDVKLDTNTDERDVA